MSELKAITILNAYQLECNDNDLVYLKSEADKVIAEKDKEIAGLKESHKNEVKQLLILNSEQANAANRLRDSMEQVICHQKHKRCLAMAKWFEYFANYWEHCEPPDCGAFIARAKFHRKWHKRWLELAEQVKTQAEAK